MTSITNRTRSSLADAFSRLWDVLRRLPFRMILLVLIVVFVGLTLWGRSASPPFTPRASNEWSKGQPIGETPLNETVAAQATSHSTYLVWADLSRQLHFSRLNRPGQSVVDTFVSVPAFRPRSPQLAVGAGDVLHLTWLDESEDESVLKYIRLDFSGQPLIDPVTVSLPGEPVELARLVLSQPGMTEIFWSGRSGIFHTTLDEAGEIVCPSTLLIPGGGTPSVQDDKQGIIHLTWLESETSRNQSVHYAVFDPEQGVLSRPAEMTFVFLRTGQSLDGLTMALDDEYGYIFWSVTDRRDNVSRTEYVTFPLEEASSAVRSELRLGGVDFIRDPFFLDGQRSKAFVAVSGTVSELGSGTQIALAIFRQGQFIGHQVITASRDASLKPAVLADAAAELHLAWLDTVEFNRYRVLYASTTDQAKQASNVLTLWDVADLVVGSAMSLTLVVLFVPLILAWSLVPLLVIVVNYLLTGDEKLASTRSWVVFAVAIVLLIVGMMTRPPGYSASFSRFGLPALLVVVALVPVYVYLRVKPQRSILAAFAIFALTIGLLRLAVYALGTVG